MALSSTRLDKFLAQYCQISRGNVRLMLAQKRVYVDNKLALNCDQIINHFSHISLDGKVVQANDAHYIMLNKPKGVVSATCDQAHKTVIDLLNYSFKQQLHIVGRLDLNSSGLMLLTNDSRFSSAITSPQQKVSKKYLVTLKNKLGVDYIDAFASGMYFPFEDITTEPAILTIINDHQAEVVLTEGKYHQIKRMFGRFKNPVLELHRFAIGDLCLDPHLNAGESRALSVQEINRFHQ